MVVAQIFHLRYAICYSPSVFTSTRNAGPTMICFSSTLNVDAAHGNLQRCRLAYAFHAPRGRSTDANAMPSQHEFSCQSGSVYRPRRQRRSQGHFEGLGGRKARSGFVPALMPHNTSALRLSTFERLTLRSSTFYCARVPLWSPQMARISWKLTYAPLRDFLAIACTCALTPRRHRTHFSDASILPFVALWTRGSMCGFTSPVFVFLLYQ